MENEILQQILEEVVKTNKRLDNVESEVKGFKQEMKEFKQEMKEFKQEMKEFKQETKQDLTEVKNRLSMIEQEHGQKLTALFDGYSLLYDMVGEIRLDVHLIKNKQEKHDFQINFLRGKESFSPERFG